MSTKDQETIARWEADLLSGRVFQLRANSERSVMGYQPVANRETWATIVERLARFAREGDQSAQLAASAIARLNLYSTNHELWAQMWEGAADAVRAQYTDVVLLASPEPGRRSDATKPYSLWVLLKFHLAMDDNRGWCLQAVARREGLAVS